MPTEDRSIGYGAKVRVHDGLTPGSMFELGYVRSITPPVEEVEEIDATHMQSPNRTRETVPGLINPGNMTINLIHVEGSDTDEFLADWASSGENRTLEIEFPNGRTRTFPATYKSYAPDVPFDNLQTGALTVKQAGATVRGQAAS